MYDSGFAYRFRRKLAQTSASLLTILVVFGILGFIAGMSLYNWRVSVEHDSELVKLREEIRGMHAQLGDINALKRAAYASASYAELSARAAMATRADVGQLAKFTRTGWDTVAENYRVDVPEFEPVAICGEYHNE